MVTILLRPQCGNSMRPSNIYVSRKKSIDSDNGSSPAWRQEIICTNIGILLIGSLGTNFSEILIENYTFSLRNMHWKCHLENGSHLSPGTWWYSFVHFIQCFIDSLACFICASINHLYIQNVIISLKSLMIKKMIQNTNKVYGRTQLW